MIEIAIYTYVVGAILTAFYLVIRIFISVKRRDFTFRQLFNRPSCFVAVPFTVFMLSVLWPLTWVYTFFPE